MNRSIRTLRGVLYCALQASWVLHLTAQVVVQDDKGRSALLIPTASFVGINTGDGSAEVSFTHLTSRAPVFYGASLRGKSTEGLSSLFGSGELRASAQVSTTVGFKAHNFLFAGRYGRGAAEVALIDSSARPTAGFAKRTVYTWDAGLQTRWLMAETYGFGLAVGRRRSNNYDALPKASMETVGTEVDTTTGFAVNVRQVKEGRIGVVREVAVNYIDADFIWAPPVADSSILSVRGFVRTLPGGANKSSERNSIGFDVGVQKKGGDVIRDRLAALVFQVNEARAGDKETGLRHRISVSVVTNLLPLAEALFTALPAAKKD